MPKLSCPRACVGARLSPLPEDASPGWPAGCQRRNSLPRSGPPLLVHSRALGHYELSDLLLHALSAVATGQRREPGSLPTRAGRSPRPHGWHCGPAARVQQGIRSEKPKPSGPANAHPYTAQSTRARRPCVSSKFMNTHVIVCKPKPLQTSNQKTRKNSWVSRPRLISPERATATRRRRGLCAGRFHDGPCPCITPLDKEMFRASCETQSNLHILRNAQPSKRARAPHARAPNMSLSLCDLLSGGTDTAPAGP